VDCLNNNSVTNNLRTSIRRTLQSIGENKESIPNPRYVSLSSTGIVQIKLMWTAYILWTF